MFSTEKKNYISSRSFEKKNQEKKEKKKQEIVNVMIFLSRACYFPDVSLTLLWWNQLIWFKK